ncbi:hypothetical protein, partial [Dankookia rubra]|uniref:hypothetical protein n=1 Tax=Dankookia rubra TaxID=1442381 RepID=UPI0019D4F073
MIAAIVAGPTAAAGTAAQAAQRLLRSSRTFADCKALPRARLAAIWTEYFQAYAWGERDGATDDDIAAAGKEMEAAARRLAI